MEKNLITHLYKINKEDRNKLNRHNSFLIFFTGLSGSGKSTIANAFEEFLHKKNVHTYTLDGDNVRKGINQNLSFSPVDRSENIRRIGEISNLFIDAGVVVLAAFIAPYKKDRDKIKKCVGFENYIEIFVNTSLEECEKRDVKGLYKLARNGKIENMTGISAPYEAPEEPTIVLTEAIKIEAAVAMIYNKIKDKLAQV